MINPERKRTLRRWLFQNLITIIMFYNLYHLLPPPKICSYNLEELCLWYMKKYWKNYPTNDSQYSVLIWRGLILTNLQSRNLAEFEFGDFWALYSSIYWISCISEIRARLHWLDICRHECNSSSAASRSGVYMVLLPRIWRATSLQSAQLRDAHSFDRLPLGYFSSHAPGRWQLAPRRSWFPLLPRGTVSRPVFMILASVFSVLGRNWKPTYLILPLDCLASLFN